MDALLKLGIDWQSIIFYIVNFGILFAVIGKFMVPPILKMLDQRAAVIEGSINEANKLKKEFEKKMEEINMEKAGSHQSMMKEMENLNKALEKKRAEMVQEMNEARAKMLEDAQKEIEVRKAQLVKDAEAQTLDLIKKVVLYIVQNKLPQDVVNQSVQDAWKVYNK